MSSITENDDENNKLSPDSMVVLVTYNKENTECRDIYINKNKFKIGRAIDCDEHILNSVISRNHCIFNYDNNQWTVTDLSSTHTIVNGEKLLRGIPTCINVGDIIQLSEVEDYKYSVSLFIKDEPNKKKARVSQDFLDEEIEKQKLFAEEQELKRRELENELLEKQSEQEKLKIHLANTLKCQKATLGRNEKLNEVVKSLEEKIKSGNEVELQMKQNYRQLLILVQNQKNEFDKRLNEEREKWQETIQMNNREKAELKNNMIEQIKISQEKRKIEWHSIINKLFKNEKAIQIKLRNENELLEKKLKEANEALKEKTIAEELKNSVEINPVTRVEVDLNNEIVETIDLTTDPIECSSNTDPIINKVGNIMDEQLTCQICSELFITAVTINCSHTFCQYCIHMWMKQKRGCPICRGQIHSVTRSLVLDNLIEQMVYDLSTQHKDRRKDLCIQRKELSAKLGISNNLRRGPLRGKRSR